MFITQTYMHICSDIANNLYKEDFMEERKDRERARGAFQKEKI